MWNHSLRIIFVCLNLSTYAIAKTELDKALEDEIKYIQAEITTASRYKEKVSDTPANVLVVTKAEIQQRGYDNLLQLLEDMPNVDVQRYSSQTNYTQVSIRGLARNNGFLILQDGVRINSPTGEPIPISDNFPLHYAKQVEVIQGPASAIYGADAFTGVINIITEKAKDIDGIRIKASVGEYNTYSTYVSAGKELTDKLSVVAGGHFKDSDNANLAKDYPDKYALNDLTTFGGDTLVKAEDRAGYRGETQSYSAYFKLNYDDKFHLGLNHNFFQSRTDAGALPDKVDYNGKASWNTELGTAYIDYQFDITDDFSALVRANYSWYELKPDSKFKNVFSSFEDAYKYAKGDRKQIELNLDYVLNENHHFVSGVTFESYSSIPKTTDLSREYDTNKGVDEQGIAYIGSDETLDSRIFKVNYTNIGAYFQWHADWHKMFSTTLGIRYDVNSDYRSTINPRLGFVIKPQPATTLKFLYGTAFLAPAPIDTYSHLGSFSGKKDAQGRYTSSFFQIPNEELEPETIETLEFTLNHQFNKQLDLSATVYYNWMDDIIFGESTRSPVSDYIAGGVISRTRQNANIGQAYSYGGNISLNYQQKITKNSYLKLWGNYSYVDGELEQNNFSSALPATAKHKIKFGLTYTYLDKYTITPKVQWIDNTNIFQNDRNSETQLKTTPSYVRLDLYAQAKLHDNFSLFLNVNNVLDTKHYNARESASTSFAASPQERRRVSGGFIVKF
ncbi:MAG: TonB-dependent receptor plug domain-containing protein [Methylococcaceae bacterium]|nr:TonB-dependent receptor plug domain-containing protein [Methylococcaceae bacterium]